MLLVEQGPSKVLYYCAANDMGNRTTPSYVAFTDTERLIGDAAKSQVPRSAETSPVTSCPHFVSRKWPLTLFVLAQVAMNPMNTVFDAKRLIGRKFKDASIQADIKHWPFTVKPGPGDKPMIEGEFHPGSPK